jgi:hypothetical protein
MLYGCLCQDDHEINRLVLIKKADSASDASSPEMLRRR